VQGFCRVFCSGLWLSALFTGCIFDASDGSEQNLDSLLLPLSTELAHIERSLDEHHESMQVVDELDAARVQVRAYSDEFEAHFEPMAHAADDMGYCHMDAAGEFRVEGQDFTAVIEAMHEDVSEHVHSADSIDDLDALHAEFEVHDGLMRDHLVDAEAVLVRLRERAADFRCPGHGPEGHHVAGGHHGF